MILVKPAFRCLLFSFSPYCLSRRAFTTTRSVRRFVGPSSQVTANRSSMRYVSSVYPSVLGQLATVLTSFYKRQASSKIQSLDPRPFG